MVFYDGESLAVQLTPRLDYKVVLELAKNSNNAEYNGDGIYYLSPTRENARKLYEAGYGFEESAEVFLKNVPRERVKKIKEEPKEITLDADGLYPFQKEGVEIMLKSKNNILLADPMGCVKENSKIIVYSNGKLINLTVRDLYDRFKNGEKFFIKSYDEENKKFVLKPLIDVIYKGHKPCLKVTLSNGYELRCTYDHPILTTDGYVEAMNCGGKQVYILDHYTCKCGRYSEKADTAKVVKLSSVGYGSYVYDLKVLDTNNFIANGMVVHNCGKTVQAAMYVAKKENSLPALVVCPASLKQNWANEIKKWCNLDSYIIEGKNPSPISEEFLKKYPVVIVNYDVLGSEDKIEKENEEKRKKRCKMTGQYYKKKQLKVYGWCDEFVKHKFNTILADEVQYISNGDNIRTRGMKQICDEQTEAKKIFISGTPYETKTSQFFTCLNILNPKEFPNRYQFLYRYCDPIKTFFGWKFDGLSNADELRQKIAPFMIRRVKEEVLPQLPPKIRSIVPLTVSKADRKAYDDIDKQFQLDILSGKKDKKEQLGHIAHLKKGAVEAKKKAVVQWIKDFLETNDKLVVFIYHHDTYEYLMKEFGKISVGLTGSTPPKERQVLVDKFQKDENVKLFIGQIRAAGVGLTLTRASNACFVEFGTTAVQHEQAEDRCHRISQKADLVMEYYLILDNSIDTDVMTTLNRHNKDLKKVLDDKDNELLFNEEDVMNEGILKEYKKRNHLEKNKDNGKQGLLKENK